ncbi:glycoside hydrolase family 127 protein [Microbacterium oryzae]|uniref:glycoside hydrolase family 127 protein n=1 Tax=Microbacterium oryzae TaxID=743009 RepID=UPI0025B141CF|nr:beta-L-arabinofuranosidase domain-containing protein [Microbacterium oryzae]MDN3310998.1 glycoside hydrolase family 127 protein [Microbacterium oryzae]
MTGAAPRLEPFPLGDVALGEGSVYLRARDAMLELARAYPVDRLLAVFRANAGLDTFGAEPPGAWEGFGHPNEEAWGEDDYPGKDRAQTANLLRGHYAGHFLSMLALAAASERDEALRAKVDEMVDGLGEVQEALAATGRFSHPGFLAAYGEWQFARLEHFAPYGEIWAPYYTCHKIMAGLLDAYELVGSERALEIVVAMGRWVAQRLGRLDHDRIQRMWSLYIAGEYGGMNETLARLSRVAGIPEFLDTARLFDMDRLIDAGAAGTDILTGMHANQHLPQLIGYVREYEVTGERRYLDAVIGLWEQIVPGRIFAHGGTGESELWGPPQTVAGHIGRRNAETCATYNLLKIARLLFQHTEDPRYMAYYERASLNHVLASRRAVRSTTSPEVAYMFPVDPGALPEFDNVGTCCGGTGLENHVKHQDTVFFRAADGGPELWVNLLVPARLSWGEQAVDVVLDSGHPWSGRTALRVEPEADAVELTLHVRIPAWASGPATLRVGDEVRAGEPGAYVAIARRWSRGEVVEIDVPMTLQAEGAIDDPALRSVHLGPSVLVARDDATTTRELPLDGLRRLDGTLLDDHAFESSAAADAGARLQTDGHVAISGMRFEPVWTGSDARYHVYVRARAAEIAFAGTATDVPARVRADGRTLLDDVWSEPLPRTRHEFLDRVLESALAARRDGLLTRAELERVLTAAGAADIGGTGAGWSSRVTAADGEAARWESSEAGDVVWALPSGLDDVPLPPHVTIETGTPPGGSGWFTAAPVVTVAAIDVSEGEQGEPLVEVRIGEEPWRVYDGPVPVDAEGVVRVAARATSAAGLTGYATRELAVDTAAPAVEARVRSLGASVEITLIAQDDTSGVERIQWGGEGTFWATFQEAFVRTLGDREQIIEFSATDRAGNEGARQQLVLPALESAETA